MKTARKDELKYKAYGFSIKVVKFVSALPNQKTYWVIADQLLRSATSIGANIINYLLKETDILANILGASLLTLKGKRISRSYS